MNNKEFITELSARLSQPQPRVQKLTESLEKLMKGHLEENDTISVSGFGAFEVRKKLERVSFNPTTGQRFLVPPKLTLTYKPSEKLKDKLSTAQAVADENDSEINS